jgi:AcrR family transcriptional regulator
VRNSLLQLDPAASAPNGSLRERNKADKLRRIKAAARELFSRKGYEATTTREIAERAGVSVGTVFVYAKDKGDLVCLMAVDRLRQEFTRAFEACDRKKPLLEQLVSICAHMFRDSARNLPLSRILIKEMTAYRNKHQIDEWIISHLERLVIAASKRQELAFDEDPAFVARAFNLAYLAVMRDWIMSECPRPSDAISNLRRMFSIQLHGLNYSPAPRRKKTSVSLPRR